MSELQGLSDRERRQAIDISLRYALMRLPRSARYGDSAFNMEYQWVSINIAVVAAAQRFAWDTRVRRQDVVFIECLVSRLGYELQRRRVFYAPLAELDQTPQRPFQTYISPSVAQLVLTQFQQELQSRLVFSRAYMSENEGV